jgi:hypothetical protein
MRYIDAAVAMLKASDPETPVTVYMIRQLVAAGTIPSIPIGRRRLLNYDVLEDYLAHPGRHEQHEAPEQRGGIRQVGL